MNRIPRLPLLLGLLCSVLSPHLRAQQEAPETEEGKRVQYQLVLPDEKTPETVKPEEHNPFESESEAQSRLAPGDSEENRVRDRLLKLPVVGVKRMADGRMRVLLGNLILETGVTVDSVLPEQTVELKVKNITSQYIELAWQEKRASGLPPKLMVIPINIDPKVRYKMLGQPEEEAKSNRGPNATMNLTVRDRSLPADSSPPSTNPAEKQPPKAQLVMDDALPADAPSLASKKNQPGTSPAATTPPAAPTAPSPARVAPGVESMVRMLFGSPAPPAK